MDHSEDFRKALLRFVERGDTAGIPEEIRMPPIAWAPPR